MIYAENAKLRAEKHETDKGESANAEMQRGNGKHETVRVLR